MKILLCQSYLGQRTGEPLVFPLGLAYIATAISGEHEVRCWDPNVSSNAYEELAKVVDEFSPEVVGISLRNIDSAFSFNKRSYYYPFVSMVKIIKRHAPESIMVVGGTAFSLFSREVMERNPEIDFGVVSEGELCFVELLRNLDHPEKVHDLVFRKNGHLIYTSQGMNVNFSNLPSVDRSFFALDKYKKSSYSIGIQSKRGCSYSCAFCPNRFLTRDGCALRSPEKVVDEIEKLVNEYAPESFYFVDATFNSPLWHAREICREIIRRKIDVKWAADFRPEFMNASFVKEAVAAGCDLFSISPDAASDSALQLLRKGNTISDVEKTIELISRTEGANVAYSFLYDFPDSNVEHMLGLGRIIPKIMLKCRSKAKFISLSRVRIYPHTEFYKMALKEGKITKDTDLLFPLHYESNSSALVKDFMPKLCRNSSILFQRVGKLCQLPSKV